VNTIRVSATHARNNFFELLEKVSMGTQVLVERNNKLVAVIVPRKSKVDWEGLKKVMDDAHGILKDFDLSKSPLRGKKSKAWLSRISKY